MASASWASGAFSYPSIEALTAHIEGRRMHYLKTGSGPDLILLHGLLGTAAAWELTLPPLAAESTVYAIDALCIGESERVAGIDPSLPAQAERVLRFMQAVGIDSADFLATSHGGSVAMMLAARYPERVKSLVLHAPANPFSHLGDPLVHFYLSRTGRWFASRISALPRSLQAVALGRMYGDATQVRKGSLETYMSSLRIPGTVHYLLSLLGRWFEDMRRLSMELEKLRRFSVLLLWGDRDRAVSLESGRSLLPYFGQAEMVMLPGAGHLPYEECPQLFAAAVTAFLRRQRQESTPTPTLVKPPAAQR